MPLHIKKYLLNTSALTTLALIPQIAQAAPCPAGGIVTENCELAAGLSSSATLSDNVTVTLNSGAAIDQSVTAITTNTEITTDGAGINVDISSDTALNDITIGSSGASLGTLTVQTGDSVTIHGGDSQTITSGSASAAAEAYINDVFIQDGANLTIRGGNNALINDDPASAALDVYAQVTTDNFTADGEVNINILGGVGGDYQASLISNRVVSANTYGQLNINQNGAANLTGSGQFNIIAGDLVGFRVDGDIDVSASVTGIDMVTLSDQSLLSIEGGKIFDNAFPANLDASMVIEGQLNITDNAQLELTGGTYFDLSLYNVNDPKAEYQGTVLLQTQDLLIDGEANITLTGWKTIRTNQIADLEGNHSVETMTQLLVSNQGSIHLTDNGSLSLIGPEIDLSVNINSIEAFASNALENNNDLSIDGIDLVTLDDNATITVNGGAIGIRPTVIRSPFGGATHRTNTTFNMDNNGSVELNDQAQLEVSAGSISWLTGAHSSHSSELYSSSANAEFNAGEDTAITLNDQSQLTITGGNLSLFTGIDFLFGGTYDKTYQAKGGLSLGDGASITLNDQSQLAIKAGDDLSVIALSCSCSAATGNGINNVSAFINENTGTNNTLTLNNSASISIEAGNGALLNHLASETANVSAFININDIIINDNAGLEIHGGDDASLLVGAGINASAFINTDNLTVNGGYISLEGGSQASSNILSSAYINATNITVNGGIVEARTGGRLDIASVLNINLDGEVRIHGTSTASATGTAMLVAPQVNINGGTLEFTAGSDNIDMNFDILNISSGTIEVNNTSADINSTMQVTGQAEVNGSQGNLNTPFLDITNSGFLTLNGNDIQLNAQDITLNGGVRIDPGHVLAANTLTGSGEVGFGISSSASVGKLELAAQGIDFSDNDIKIYVTGPGLQPGDAALIASGSSAASVVNGEQILSNNINWTFTLHEGTDGSISGAAEEVYVIAQQNNEVPDDEIDELLEDITNGNTEADDDLEELAENILDSETIEEYAEKVESTLPAEGEIALENSLIMSQNTINYTQNQLQTVRLSASGITSGDQIRGLKLWGDIFADKVDQDKRQNLDGYKLNNHGFIAGLETSDWLNNTTVGATLSYSNARAKSKSANLTRTEIESVEVSLYGEHELNKNIYLSFIGGYGYNQNDFVRYDIGGTGGNDALGDFASEQYFLQAKLSRDYQPTGKQMTITPNLLAYYVNYQSDDYTETGAGSVGLADVSNNTLQIFDMGAGVELAWQHDLASGATLEPRLDASYRYDFIGDQIETTGRFIGGGSTFSAKGFKPARHSMKLGSGLTYKAKSGTELSVEYDYKFKSDYQAHSGALRIAVPIIKELK